jgi:hypothetical protein
MLPLSATDAIGPAFTHTRTVLAPPPFRLWRFYKLAVVAAFAQSSFVGVACLYPLQAVQFLALSHSRALAPQQFASSPAVAAVGLAVLGVLAALFLIFTLGMLYLVCRLRVTLFDLVVVRGGYVRDAWRRHARPAWRYMLLYLLGLLVWMIVLSALLGPFLIGFIKTAMAQGQSVAAGGSGGATGRLPAAMLSQMLLLIGLSWLLFPVWLAIDAMLQDFILPVLALEQRCTLGAAFSRLGTVTRRAPGQLLLYLVLRTAVSIGIALALGLVAVVALGVLGLGGYGLGRLLYNGLWSGGLGARTVFFAAAAAVALVFIALYLLAVVAIYGVTGVFKAGYAAYFYAGYYPELAAILDGPPPDGDVLVGAGLPDPPPTLQPLRAKSDLPELW